MPFRTVESVVPAAKRGVPTLVKFFGRETARELAATGIQGDLVLGNNVFAQVTDPSSFVEGIHTLLKPTGVCTIEFPHLLKTMDGIDRPAIARPDSGVAMATRPLASRGRHGRPLVRARFLNAELAPLAQPIVRREGRGFAAMDRAAPDVHV